jgi:hypothetical protein
MLSIPFEHRWTWTRTSGGTEARTDDPLGRILVADPVPIEPGNNNDLSMPSPIHFLSMPS